MPKSALDTNIPIQVVGYGTGTPFFIGKPGWVRSSAWVDSADWLGILVFG